MTGEISITQDGQSVLAGKVHDWKLESGSFDANTGKLTLNTKDSYGTETDKVEIDGIAGKDYVDRKDKLNVKYDSEAKETVTLGGTGSQTPVKLKNVAAGVDDTDAVNLSQLKNNVYDKYVSSATWDTGTGKLNLTVANGEAYGKSKEYSFDLGTYIADKDDYVTGAEVTQGEDGKDQVVLKRKNGGTVTMDISSLTGSMSTTDYRLIGSGEDGKGAYTPDDQGNITLKVKDDKTGKTEEVKLADIASATDVTKNTTNIGILQEADKLNVKYDSEAKETVTLGGTGSQTPVKLKNVAAGVDDTDAVNLSQLKNNVYDKYVSSATWDTGTGKLNLTVANGEAYGKSKEYSFDLGTYIADKDDYVTGAEVTQGEDGKDQVVLKRKNGGTVTMDISSLTGSMSTTDYRLIGSGEDGKGAYTPDDQGNITLKVKDDKTGKTEEVKLADIASATDVTKNTTNIGILQEADKLNVKYDSVAKNIVTLGGSTYDSETHEGGTTITNVADGKNASDAVNFSQLSEVKREAGKHTTIEPTGTNITVTQNSAKGEALNYTVDLNPVVTLDGTAGDDKQIVLDGNNGTISAENSNTAGLINKTTTDNTFDFDENGGTFTTTETTTSLGGIVQKGTMKHEATFDGDGATFTKSALSLSEGPENSSTNIDGGTVTVQGDEIFGLGLTNKTVIDGGTITVTGSGLTGGRTVIDGKKITAGDIKVNNESGATITGLSNQTIDYAGFGGGRAATEAQLKLMQEQISDDLTVTASDGIAINSKNEISVNYGDGLTLSGTKDETTGTKKLQVKGGDGVTVDGNGVSVNVGSNLEINDKNEVALQKDVDLGAGGSLKVGGVVTLDETGAAIGSVKVNAETSTVDGLANKEWTKGISDAIANKDTDAMGRAASQGQLYDVAEIANNAYAEAGKHTTMTVNGGTDAPAVPEGETEGAYTDKGNLLLKQTVTNGQTEYDVKLNDDLYLGGNQTPKDSNIALNGSTGYISATIKDSLGTSGTSSDTLTFDDQGLTVSKEAMGVGSGATNISGDTIKTTDEYAHETTIDGGKVTTEALEVKGNSDSDNTMTFDAEGLNVNTGDAQLNVSEDGLSLNVDNGAGRNNSVKITQEGTTFSYSENGVTGATTTVIQGQKITAGDVLINGEDGKNTITGLTNTTWKNDAAWQADNIVANRAATEGQLQTVADTVNAGWTATDDADNKINVNPKDHPTLNFASGKNVTVSAADGEISVSLNDEVKLGDYDNGTGIYLSGASGTISATNSISVGEALVIDGNKKTVNGLSNKTWSKDSFVSGQAATEDQLDAMADWTETQVNNSGWTASTNGGKKDEKTEAITNGETVDFSNTDSNIKVSQDVTANGTSIKFNLNDDLLLGANAEGAGINISGTAGEIVIKSANGSAINIGNGVITGLTNTVSNENWETFMNSDLGNNGSRAVTEDDLQLVAQHSVQYKTNDDGTIDYNNIFLSGASYSSDGHTGGTMITNVAYASDSDGSAAVNVDKLHDAISDAKTEVTNADKHLNYDKTYSVDRETNKVNLEVVDNQGNVVGNTTIEDVASATDVGNIGDLNSDIAHDSTGDGNVSIVDAVNNVDNKVGDLNYKHDDGSDLNYVTAGDSVTGAIGDLDAAIKDAATEAGQHSSVSGSDNITVAENGTNGNGGTDYKVSLDDDLALGGKEGQNGSIAITGSEGTITASGNVSAGSFTTGSITINGANEDGTHTGTINGLSNKTWDANNIVSGQAATEDQLKAATEGAVQYDRNEDGTVNKGSITLGGSTYNEETHEGGTTITNVADGKNASDAVNMSQLWQTNQAVINNSNNISMLSNSVNKLDNRIDRVGAGAAALAALHPLDFDPDAKWDFAAGYGNYRGANAVAVGAYYRPNEDVMFSVGGSMGGGENMVNAGVSLKIGAGSSGVTTSRVAMAKEIKAMRDVVAKQDAQIQKLTAMVNALVGIQAEPDTTTMFPDVPENHWAYEAVEAMAKSGLVKGYPDGEFKGDRTMTRYEFAQIVYNAIQAGAEVDARLVEEFKPELEYFHIATVAKDKDGNPTIERVRAN